MLGILAVLPARAACRPIPGAERLWSRPGLRFLLVGEMHGTAEAPAIFGDLVCAALAAGRPVVAGVERSAAEQDAINKGSFVAQSSDGRSSRAMLQLVQDLHKMKVAEVVAFSAEDEERMAAALKAAAERHAGALVIALSGNVHASKKMIEGIDYSPMAMLLPADATVSLYVADRGGMAWNCQEDGCGPHALRSSHGERREVSLTSLAGYDGALSTGTVCTASPPALGK
jgi:hypothetical protein